MRYECWQTDPVPIWGVEADPDERFDWTVEPVMDLIRRNGGVTMRGVSIDRLPYILEHGIDVDPTDAVIYCEWGDKAYEYGKFPKVLMALRYRDDAGRDVLYRARQMFSADATPEQLAEAARLYPHEWETLDDGRAIRFRVEPESAAVESYLGSYGHFVPGDPWEALVAVFVFGTADDLVAAREMAEQAKSS